MNLEALQNRADFICEILKLANVGITGASYNSYMSSLGYVVHNVVKHIAA
jgi:hypothetical protein